MANILPKEKQVAVVAALAEGSSIRSIERMTGINRNTIMNLGVRVGQGCAATVLHLPPAITPLRAVQASIVSDVREQQANAEN